MRAAIIGSGHIARSHVDSFRRLNVDVVSNVNPHIERAEAFAREYSIPSFHKSLGDLLSDYSDLDFISVCTPTYTHMEYTLKALSSGLSVYLEKPIAMNYSEALSIDSQAHLSNKSVMVAYNNRYREGSVLLKRLVESGSLGDIYHTEAYWARHSGVPGLGSWFTDRSKSGGGCLIDLIHMLDLALFVTQPKDPLYVLSSNTDYFLSEEFNRPGRDMQSGAVEDAESSSYAYLTFSGHRDLYIHSSWAEMMDGEEEIYLLLKGSKGWARLSWREGEDILEYSTLDNGRVRVSFPSLDMGRFNAAKHFVESLEGGIFIDASDSLPLMKIVDAIYRSNELEMPVKIT